MTVNEYFALPEVFDDVVYRQTGEVSNPVLVLGNSLGTDTRLWNRQVEAWKSRFRIIGVEYPGHGSPCWDNVFDMAGFAKKFCSLLDYLDVDQYAFCGLSMGGAIGMELAIMDSHRMNRLVLSNTAAEFGAPEFWQSRGATAVDKGISALEKATLDRWFTAEFTALHPETVELARSMLLQTNPRGYATCCRAIGDFSLASELAKIKQPTMVVAGKYDRATTPKQANSIVEAVSDGHYREIAAAHLGNLGAEVEFNSTVGSFLY